MLVLERDPRMGVFSWLPDPDLDGVGSDVWGNEWPLGSTIDQKMVEPFPQVRTWRHGWPRRRQAMSAMRSWWR